MARNNRVQARRDAHKASRLSRMGVRRAVTGLGVLTQEVEAVVDTIPADLSLDLVALSDRLAILEP